MHSHGKAKTLVDRMKALRRCSVNICQMSLMESSLREWKSMMQKRGWMPSLGFLFLSRIHTHARMWKEASGKR